MLGGEIEAHAQFQGNDKEADAKTEAEAEVEEEEKKGEEPCPKKRLQRGGRGVTAAPTPAKRKWDRCRRHMSSVCFQHCGFECSEELACLSLRCNQKQKQNKQRNNL